MKVKNQVVVGLLVRLAVFAFGGYLIVDGATQLFGSPAGYIASGLLCLLALRKS